MANLLYLSEYFFQAIFGYDVKARLKPKYYPFVPIKIGVDLNQSLNTLIKKIHEYVKYEAGLSIQTARCRLALNPSEKSLSDCGLYSGVLICVKCK